MKTLLYIFCLISFNSFSTIWKTERNWYEKNNIWETKFSEWVQSDDLRRDLFVNPESPYNGIAVDCADVMYLLRAIFSYENGLDFIVLHPLYTWGPHKKYYTNLNNSWNYLPREERFVAFLKHLADNFGTQSLAHHDSFSIAPEDIRPGDFFMFEKQLDPNSEIITRHAFMIKNVTPTGLFDIIYSTQTARDEGKQMYYKKNHMFSPILAPEKKKWGFKRFKKPTDYYRPKSAIKAYNNMQYDIVAENDGAFFFAYIQSKLQTEKENPEKKTTRLFNDLCERMNGRVEAVNDALSYKQKINERCMNASEYDIYSTPLRDGRIKGAFNIAKYFVNEVEEDEEITIENPLYAHLYNIFQEDVETVDLDLLKEQCPVNYSEEESMDLNEVYSKIVSEEFSSNPNDDIYARWGIEPSTTNCKI